MFANKLPNSWVHSNSSRMSQMFTYKGNPMASIQIRHIYAVDSGLHNIKFIIYPIHSQILWVFDRNTENFSGTWTRDVNWKNLQEKPKLLNLLSITSWESFPGTYLWCRNQSFKLKKKKFTRDFLFYIMGYWEVVGHFFKSMWAIYKKLRFFFFFLKPASLILR